VPASNVIPQGKFGKACGIIVRQGLRFLRQALPDILAKRTDALSPRIVRIVVDLSSEWRRLDERIETVSDEIETVAKSDDNCRRVMTVPGIGPIISSAMLLRRSDAPRDADEAQALKLGNGRRVSLLPSRPAAFAPTVLHIVVTAAGVSAAPHGGRDVRMGRKIPSLIDRGLARQATLHDAPRDVMMLARMELSGADRFRDIGVLCEVPLFVDQTDIQGGHSRSPRLSVYLKDCAPCLSGLVSPDNFQFLRRRG
jgi:hypothetical protein